MLSYILQKTAENPTYFKLLSRKTSRRESVYALSIDVTPDRALGTLF
jgi:hypothetical protein